MKTKSNQVTVERILQHFEESDVILTDFERTNIGILLDSVKAGLYWHKHKDEAKAEMRMQEARELASTTFPDVARRMQLNSVILDMYE